MQICDLIIKNINEIVTPKNNNHELQIINHGLIGVKDGLISYVGPHQEGVYLSNEGIEIDAGEGIVLPGFVDPHTHLIFSGTRENEFHLRLQGATYLDILKAGGGIIQTVKKVRESSLEDLYEASKMNLLKLVKSGITTIESKSGYGLDLLNEIKMLEVMKRLNKDRIARLVPTFMGLHALPPEYNGKKEEYIDYVTSIILPEIAKRELAVYVDAFVENGVFLPHEVRPFLTKAKELGFKIRLHVDEFSDIEGASLAAEMKANTADHLLHSNYDSLMKMTKENVVAILLPGTVFSLGLETYPQFEKFNKLGIRVALGTDFNPGTSMVESMEFVISLAVTKIKIPIEEAITAATLNGAYSLGLENITGSLEIGKSADMIIFDLNNYKQLGYLMGVSHVKGVIFEGKIIHNLTK